MITIRFYLKDSRGYLSIWVKISTRRYTIHESGQKEYQPLRLAVGLSGITPRQWDKKIGRLHTRADKSQGIDKHMGAVQYNGMLDRAEARIYELVLNDTLSNKTNEQIKEALNNDNILNDILGRSARKIKDISIYDDRGVFLFIQNEIIDKATVKKVTKQTYISTLAQMEAFEKYRGRLTTWKTINEEYYNEFTLFLYNQDKKPNTVGKYIKILKKFLNEASFKNIEVCQDYKSRGRFTRPTEDSQATYLTLEELNRIEALDYSANPSLDRVRDWLLIGSNTALRVSDLMSLQPYNILSDRIKVDTQKTGVDVIIPILPQLRRVLDKNNGNTPTPLSHQKYNKYLKRVCKDAKIDDEVIIKEKQGNLYVPTKKPKYELITSHTARRTFATNMYRRTDIKISISEIMLITGHATESSFRKYIRVTKDENADTLLKKIAGI